MKDRQKLLMLIADARYESAPGAHTYHDCKCGRHATRLGECIMCLLEKMEFLCMTKRERIERKAWLNRIV